MFQHHAKTAPTIEVEARSVESFGHDGLEIARRRRHSRGLPLVQFVQLTALFVALRIILCLQLGPAAYGAKAAELAEGGVLERFAGFAMRLDPVSLEIVSLLRGTMGFPLI